MQSPTGDPRSPSTRYHWGARRTQAQREVCGELSFCTPPLLPAAVGVWRGLGLVVVRVLGGQEEELDKEERKREQAGTYWFLCVCHHIRPQ
ncbi:unnamed protein product [Rangifer tarandus platyrhynchus]|uniref:Uncharacterized protein n=2 Tax=Rangifer tarandus platyrhynchus TaxID=3082113 RepID=A0ABN8ZF53_RANTA|nr:unnamed protein product [Rangifer tarandus platyrhynchus]CAI9707938.1 unnamed protein product [Rangifer tarandus platyrhynchus]